MKPEIFVPQTEIVTPDTLPAQPKDTTPNAWMRHTGTLLGALGVASLLKSASAQDMSTPPMTATPPMTGTMPMPPAPTDSQAVEGNSAVPSTSRNPNNPANTIPASAKTATPGDVDILNFALGLEYLEADFYSRVVAAHQARAYLTPKAFMAAQKLAADEAAHVTAITDILTRANATPVAKPNFVFQPQVFYSQIAFLETATAMEETGVGAYLGAAPKVMSNDALKFAASVYGIECRHTALIRSLDGRLYAPANMEAPFTMEQVQRRVAAFMAT